MKAYITVIIPTMNRPASLRRTLASFAAGSVVPSEIVVVDQSAEESVRQENRQVLAELSDKLESYKIVFQQKPSLTKARNTGLAQASHDILIFADDDIDVNPDTVANVISIMSDLQIAMIGGIDELTQKSSTNSGYFFGTKSFSKRHVGHVTRSVLGRYPDNISRRISTEWAMGYFFVVRKSLCAKWNCRWDENLTSYAYAEDLDFSYSYFLHAEAEGMKCILDPTVKVKHLASLEYRIPGEKSICMYIINREYLRHKHMPGMGSWLACNWCNFWRLVESIARLRQPRFLWHAMINSVRYRRQIHKGVLDYELFMNKK